MNARRVLGPAAAAMFVLAGGSAGQDLQSASAVRQWRGETDLTVNVRFGVGVFTFSRETDGLLFRGNVVFDNRYFTAVNRYAEADRTLEVGTRARMDDLDDVDLEGQRLDLRVTPQVPLTTRMEFGVGKASVDLGGLRLERAEITSGASESTIEFSRPTAQPCRELSVKVGAAEFALERLGNSNCATIDVAGAAGSLLLDFTGEWQAREMEAKITLGLGGLTLRFPRGLGVAISLNRFLASFDRNGFEKRGDRYLSPGYDEAHTRVAIDLKAIVGDVSVEWVER